MGSGPGPSPRDRTGAEPSDAQPSVAPSISLLAWALDEEENVTSFLESAHAFLSLSSNDYELILIDDGSSDRTLRLLEEAAAADARIHVFSNGMNRGVGASFARALGLATKDWIIWQTFDWSYDLAWFEENFRGHLHFDVLHGSRWLAGPSLRAQVRQRSDSIWKGVISFGNFLVVRALLRIPLSDVQNVAMVRADRLTGLRLASKGSAVSPELLMHLVRRGCSILEVPVGFLPRQRGVAKGTSPRSILRSLGELARLRRSRGRISAVERAGARVERWSQDAGRSARPDAPRTTPPG